MSAGGSFREVELRHPHKSKHLNPLDSAMNLADDFYMDDDSDSELGKKVAPTVWDHILLNRPAKVVFAMLIAVLVIPTLLYGFMYGLAKEAEPFGSCSIRNDFWSECMPGSKPSRDHCIEAGCCWNATRKFCHHSLPARHNYYFVGAAPNPEAAPAILAPRLERSPLGADPLTLNLTTEAVSAAHVVVQLTARNRDSLSAPKLSIDETDVKVEIKNGEAFSLSLKRRSDNALLFKTDNGPLVATDGFWEWSFQFPENSALLGAGASSRGSLMLKSGNATLYQTLGSKSNGRPYILCIAPSGKAHGVLFEAPGAIEVVARPTNLVSVRSTAGAEYMRVHAFVGNDTAQVFDALTSHIGRPTLPPYWALGLHICRDAARSNANDEAKTFREEAEKLNLPYDTDCIDDSAAGNVSFIYEMERVNKLIEEVKTLRSDGRRFLFSQFGQVSVDVAAYEDGFAKGIFLGNSSRGVPFVGIHRDQIAAYPDLDNPDVTAWLRQHMSLVLNSIRDALPSGIVVADNWPLNEMLGQDDGPEKPHYVPQGLDSLSYGTVLWNANGFQNSDHHHVHNSYGHKLAGKVEEIFNEYISGTTERVPILSAASWIHEPQRGWLGEEQQSDWNGLKAALLSVLEAGISGEPFSGGGPICGASGNWSGSLCTRWSLLALNTFPLTRYHHRWGSLARDPTAMDESSGRIVARAARLRYELMPYLYTHLHQASLTGMPLVRPMAVEFSSDNATWTLDEQFMVGPSLMAAPALEPAAVSLKIYLPRSSGPWYHLQGGEKVQDYNGTGQVTLYATENELILLIRGGHIIAMQDAGKSSDSSRLNPRHVIVGLICDKSVRLECKAEGFLYLDDGISKDSLSDNIRFNATSTTLTVSLRDTPDFCNSALSTKINAISIYGLPRSWKEDSNLTVDGVDIENATLDFDNEEHRLRITDVDINWCENPQSPTVIAWELSS
ncbi:probable maltase-glucoamylase 2 [Neocloeon triangulifer]|uniref:probable maltase-glucoamylase 2 n=1 Tax=Neocloeon triangulifer TaxID=2078957 RepID=UPI00286F4107|nr:probable maltase-glucoamylase 2 [Neocloeon triangulifer]XP_059479289.1 probable maltase-glucoamylase 2 [Neocloeon triangulifer]